MQKLSLILLFVLAPLLQLSAQEKGFYPLINNYSYQSYNAGNSNWCILEDDRGIMYFSNKLGILEYDGQNWDLIESPKQQVAQSLAKDEKGVIYAGFVGDIGYLKSDKKGKTIFSSLKSKLPLEHQVFKAVFTTYFLNGKIYFQTKSKLFRWDGKEMKVLVSKAYFQRSSIIDGNFYIGVWKKGLFILDEGRFELKLFQPELAQKEIYVIQPYSNDTLLVGTRNQGFFLCDSKSIQPFPTEADNLIKNQLYTPGLKTKEDQYLLNTLGNGAILINKKGNLLSHLSKDVGLQDNTVNYTYLDSRGILWLALFNGISSVDLASPFTFLNDELGLPFKTTYDLEQHQGKLYAGSINGLHVFDQEEGVFHLVKGSYAAVYQLFKFKNRLYGAGYGMGFFEVVNNEIRFVKKNNNDNFKVTMIRQSKVDSNRIFIDWREGLVTYYFNEALNQFEEESRTTKFHPTYKGFEVDKADRVWMIGNQKSQLKQLETKSINGQVNLDQSPVITFDSSQGLPTDLKYVFQLNNELHFLGKKAFQFNESENRFEEFSTFYEKLYQPKAQFFSYPTKDHLGRIWMQPGDGVLLKTQASADNQVISSPFRAIKDFPIWNTLIDKKSTSTKTVAWFNGTNGIIRYEGNPVTSEVKPYNTLIRKIVMNEDSLLYSGGNIAIEPFDIYQGNGNLTINFATTIYSSTTSIRYQTMLEGLENNWSAPSSLSKKSFFNLPIGKYTFKVKANDIQLKESKVAIFTFSVLPNWWQSWWINLLLLFLIGLILYGIVKFGIRRSTQKLEARQKELEVIVSQRTAQIEKDKSFIEQQAEELKELDKIKSKFFANISHELRTPLTLILGPLSYILDSPEEWNKTQVQQQLFVMQRNGKNLLQLIEEILDLSKIEANKLELQEDATPMVQFFEYLFFVFEPQFQTKTLSYDLQLDIHQDLQVLVDRRKLEKILNNFLSNAIKFTSTNGKIILKVSETDDLIKVQVADNGKGIHPNDLPHVFERFYQSKQVDQKLYGGTGIGLALVKELAHLMDGKVKAESTLGEGSRFYFEFPKKKVAIAEVIALPINETIEDDPFIDSIGSDFNIMVVEDNPDMRDFIVQLLRKKYKQVLVAKNGAEGIALLKANKISIDLIVSDIMMPEVDGLEMLKTIKSNPEWFRIPVVMLTALAAERDKLSALTIGVDDYLTKPFSVPELMIRVQNLLYNSHQRKQVQSSEEEVTITSNSSKQQENQINEEDKKWIENLKSTIHNSLGETTLNVEELAASVFLSSRQMSRKVKSITGLTPARMVREVQLTKARKILEEHSSTSVNDLAFQCGFEHPTTFSKLFKKRFGKSPSEYMSN
ncbi:MAG: ATP-binding protein [Saprospiraceae bacterium]